MGHEPTKILKPTTAEVDAPSAAARAWPRRRIPQRCRGRRRCSGRDSGGARAGTPECDTAPAKLPFESTG